jgi:hypothetical protein
MTWAWIDRPLLIAPAPQQFEILSFEIIRIGFDQREFVLDRDTRRHLPVGIQNEIADYTRKDRRTAIRLPDDDAHVIDGLAILNDIQAKARNIHEYVAIAEILGQPAPTLEIDDELVDAALNRYVERVLRSGADDPVCSKTMARLEAAHSASNFRIE